MQHLDINTKVAVVGLGYVGLPLVVALARKFDVLGFDIQEKRVHMLNDGHDVTNEVSDVDLAASTAKFSNNPEDLSGAQIIIVAVPTPVDNHRVPDLRPILSASHTVGKYMSKGCVVCYESTVYPGVTEDECVPILERESNFKCGVDFSVGYSPERINPGDSKHKLETICKIVAASDDKTRELLANLYASIVTVGIHKTSSIKVAEAAKVIENTQRDINIALINELALIFERMGIDTLEVLEAAKTKWNFLPFYPGLVGGHCIGVDPYYLTYKAQELGYNPEIILAGRRINDGMGMHIADTCLKKLIAADCKIKGARVGILGFAFKENVPDIRNTRVVDIVKKLQSYDIITLVHDPNANAEEALQEYGQELVALNDLQNLDALIIAVGHEAFKDIGVHELRNMFNNTEVILLDIKGFCDKEQMLAAGFSYWRL